MKCELDYFKGCLLGGAVGDALGYAIEFESIEQIFKQYGDKGITELQLDKASGKALISDDTQMTLFTVEGILWTAFRNRNKGISSFSSCAFYSYQRWLYTQTHKLADSGYSWILDNEKVDYKSILMGCEGLYHRRAPGNTCLNALAGAKNQEFGTIKNHINNSKGCGGIMRSAPVGLYFWNSPEYAFQYGAESAAITHGHPSGYLSAGTLSAIVAEIITGKEIDDAVQSAMNILKTYDRHEECATILKKAMELAQSDMPEYDAVVSLGKGWVGEETLAIAVYCALKHKDDFSKAICLAVNHGGDSDSTGAVCGNILGAYLGINGIPPKWVKNVELSELMISFSDKLFCNVR